MTHDPIADLLAPVRRIAIVGASPRPDRPSHGVLVRLVARGYDVVPVHPTAREVAGIPAVARLEDLAADIERDGPIDLVDVFRRSELTAEVAEAAVALRAGGVWLQLGIRSDEARSIATAGGLAYVEDRCLAVEVAARGLGWR
jgi:uncharacterized protein